MAPDYHIRISTQAQTLTLLRLAPESLEGGLRWAPDAAGTVVMQTLISSSKNGVGQQQGSYQTPPGQTPNPGKDRRWLRMEYSLRRPSQNRRNLVS